MILVVRAPRSGSQDRRFNGAQCPKGSMVPESDFSIGEGVSEMVRLRPIPFRRVTDSTDFGPERVVTSIGVMMRQKSQQVKRGNKKDPNRYVHVVQVHPNAAGIDVGSRELWVAVPADRETKPIRMFGTFTADLNELADWLSQCGVTTVAMESTGVYWIPVFQILEKRGLDVLLVNARQTKNVAGRKSDWTDCQWIQHLHSLGMLAGSFRPADDICVWRSYQRHRDNLVQQASMQIQLMHKALTQMNIQLHHVISDVTGVTGLAILDAILAGERDCLKLAALRDPHIRSSRDRIAKALEGDYRAEHLFVLGQALQAYRFCLAQIAECDRQIEALLMEFEKKTDAVLGKKGKRRSTGHQPRFNAHEYLYGITGVDLTAIDGVDATTVMTILPETGLDMSKWPTEKHFCSWLGLSPNHQISGGKILDRKTRRVVNRATQAFRLAAQSLKGNKSALGAYFRRMKARLGAPDAITATAHKIAKIFYRTLRYGQGYVDIGQNYYEEKYRQRVLQNLKKRAKELGYELMTSQQVAAGVS